MLEHEYITLKLVNGDNIISVKIGEDDHKFTIMYPIQMKTVNFEFEGKNKEVLAGSPWCSFTDEQIFTVWKDDVIIIKPLNESTIEYYKRLIDVQIGQLVLPEEEYDLETISINLSNETIH
jgi:hypothetical protein